MTNVAIQGIKGSYSEEAAMQLMGESAIMIECLDFAETFEQAKNGADFAVVPIRNTIVGEIESTRQLLASSGLKVLDALYLDIRHVLAGATNAKFSDVVSVTSHTEALKQCGKFFNSNPQISARTGTDTASSIRRIATANVISEAAIGSRRAAEIYGARILRERIADDANNRTTFFLIGK